MLKQGITDKLILSGGQTGAHAGTSEAKTEADLMKDIIRREIGVDDKGNFYNFKGEAINFEKAILIENKSKDSLENFVNILNTYLDANGIGSGKISLLGMGFHTHATNNLGVGGANIGRLEALSQIYQLGSHVYSAEDVIKELVIDKHGDDLAIAQMMQRLINTAQTSNVTLLKAQQEGVLVDMLKDGDWLRVIDRFNSPERIRLILTKSPGALEKLGISPQELKTMDIEDIKERARRTFAKIKEGQKLYPQTKELVMNALEKMGNIDGRNMLEAFGKGVTSKKN